jgi:hypothetical protein
MKRIFSVRTFGVLLLAVIVIPFYAANYWPAPAEAVTPDPPPRPQSPLLTDATTGPVVGYIKGRRLAYEMKQQISPEEWRRFCANVETFFQEYRH